MSHIEIFERDEAAALEGLDADLQAVARTGPERAAAIDAAQAADLAASDEGRQRIEAARQAAIAADAALRTGEPGRPKTSPERYAYRELCESMQEAPDRFKLEWSRYAATIESLKAARPELDALQTQADEQSRLCQAAVKHLEDAATAYGQAVDLADAGRMVMARLGDLVAFNASPFVELTAGPRELADLAKRWALRLSAELARLGRDSEADLIAQRQRRADADYKAKLNKAAADFRKTGDGKRLWAEYRQVERVYEAAQSERPGEDLSGIREQCERLLLEFHKQAAGHAGLEFHAEAVPQV